MNVSPVELLVFQPTPFCNLNCSYCYLPHRTDRRILKVETVQITVERLLREDLLSSEVSIIWHAGEPLVVKREFYEGYFKAIRQVIGCAIKVRHYIQTNATLISDDWCNFFREHGVSVGVSIDGPAHVHNFSRHTRGGHGSFAQTMRGIETLHANGVPFHTISVITAASLNFPEGIHSFLASLGQDYMAFNVEEQEGVNVSSSLAEKAKKVEDFFCTVYRLARLSGFNPPIREFESAWQSIKSGRGSDQNCQIWPYRMFIVNVVGEFTTFSPELLGMESTAYESFYLGSVVSDSPRAVAESEKLQDLFQDIQAGVRLCQTTCEYFELCGGGSPSNKLFENGSFASAATRFCSSSIQLPLRIVLEDIESAFARGEAKSAMAAPSLASCSGAAE
jgi:uncharacterized protein